MPTPNRYSKTKSTLRVAIYADQGTLSKCIDKSLEILSNEPDIRIEKIFQKDILEEKLAEYQVLLLPGGTANGEGQSLGKEGCEKIIEFTRKGNGIIATCAGAYLISKGWNQTTRNLELINSEVYDLDHWARGVQIVECKINTASQKLKGNIFHIYFENGPPLVPSDLHHLPSYVSLATYMTDLHAKEAPSGMMKGKDAIIASYYGNGKILSFSPHPELTPGLEQMLVKAVRWVSHPYRKNETINWESVFGKDMQFQQYSNH